MYFNSTRSIVSGWALWSTVIACVVAAWIAIPDQKELVNRLDKDGHLERLQALAKEAEADRVVSQKSQLSDREKLRQWLTNSDATVRDDDSIQAEQKLMCSITMKPIEVAAELVANGKNMDPELFGYFADTLSRRALGLQKPAEAGWILTEWFKRDPSWELANRAVEAWRWGLHSDQALNVINLAMKTKVDDPQAAPAHIDDLRVKLAMESNQPDVAFDIEYASYKQAAPADQSALIKPLLELANAGSRTAEATQIIADHLSHFPFHTVPFDEALTLARDGKAFPSATEEGSYREYAAMMARWQEWGNQGNVAFDTWIRLALLGHQEAWDRCLDLYEDVLRNSDFVKVLDFRVEHGLSLDQESMLADLLAEDGRMEDALKHYQSAASHATNPTPILRAVARIYQQAGDWGKAISFFEQVLQLAPADLEAGKGRAFAMVRQKRYEEAKVAYCALAKANPEDAELQETCVSLCDSLGYPAEAREAAQRLMACENHASTPEDLVELAARFRDADDQEGLLKVLREGFTKFPDSTRLRFSLAETLAAQQLHNEAIRLLAHKSFRDNPAAIDMLISEAMDATNGAEALAFLGNEVPDCLKNMPATQLRLAFLFDHFGRTSVGTGIVNRLLHNSAYRQGDKWQMLAKLSLDFGSNERAESFITLYLASSGSNDSKAWELLGDIYQAEDRENEASTAYQKAIEVLKPVTSTKTPNSPLKVSQAVP